MPPRKASMIFASNPTEPTLFRPEDIRASSEEVNSYILRSK